MKKYLIILGYIVGFFICTGTLFKLQHWPGAGPLLIVGFTLFSMVFIPTLFIHRIYENRSRLNFAVNLFALFSLSSTFIGVLFKVQHWPGAGAMLLVGSLFFLFPTLILYIIQQFKEYDRKFSEFYKTILAIVIASVFFIVYALNYSRDIIVTYLKIEETTIETNSNLLAFNQFLLGEINRSNQDNFITSAVNIDKYAQEAIATIEQIKQQLIEMSEGENSEAFENHWAINSLDNYDIPSYFLGNQNSEGADHLLKSLNELREKIKSELNRLPLVSKDSLINDLGDLGIKTDPDNRMSYKENTTWQEEMFYHTPIAGTLAILTSLQNQVLSAEFRMLSIIHKNINTRNYAK